MWTCKGGWVLLLWIRLSHPVILKWKALGQRLWINSHCSEIFSPDLRSKELPGNSLAKNRHVSQGKKSSANSSFCIKLFSFHC